MTCCEYAGIALASGSAHAPCSIGGTHGEVQNAAGENVCFSYAVLEHAWESRHGTALQRKEP